MNAEQRLPSGTVTFLFTDIEGSTKLARSHPETWEAARARHYVILRGAIESNQGYVFQVIGDAFCAAFHTAAEAVKAAIQAQQELQAEPWDDVVIRVRMGIHTGEALVHDGEYHGYLTMSMVQRLMSAGHGGQILISDATEKLLRSQLSHGVSLLDKGEHKFKDVPHLTRVFQVCGPGLEDKFPPLRTLEAHPNNLPAQLTSFVGREKELADVKRLLQNAHMLTLIGPGGTGKTRLSIRAASEMLNQYAHGVWLVELAPILDPLLVPRTTAIAIGLRDEPQRPVIDMLCDYLQEKSMLILLDNCEHLVDACAQMADRILHAAPGVRILASSREALGIGGEVTYRVPSLGMPDLSHLPSLESLDQYEAVKLFIDRASSANSSFTVTNDNAPFLAQICYRLDGIPLAIELAAAKTRALSLDQISKRLDDRFRLLTGGSRTALERHQTLRAAIDWSYNLLPTAEQALFRSLSIFVNGWTLEAAETICSDTSVHNEDVLDLLEHLINKSLVIMVETQVGTRYQMLETIRQYANERLVESGESDVLRDRHLDYFLSLTETAEFHIRRSEQLEWLPVLDSDYENLRLAFERTMSKETAEPAFKICIALWWYWKIRCTWLEGLSWVRRAVAMSSQTEMIEQKAIRARVLATQVDLEWQLGNFEQMLSPAQENLGLALDTSDKRAIAIAKFYMGVALRRRGIDYGRAYSLIEQSFTEFQALQEEFWQAYTFPYLEDVVLTKIQIRDFPLENLVLAQKAGDRLILADALMNYAFWLWSTNQADEAGKHAEESDRLYKEIGAQNSSLNSIVFAGISWLDGDIPKARSFYLQLHDRLALLGEKPYRANSLALLGLLSMEEGDLRQAREYLEQSLALWHEIGLKIQIANHLAELSTLCYLEGNLDEFKKSFRECISLREHLIIEIFKVLILMTILGALYPSKPENSAQILGVIYSSQRANPNLRVDPIAGRYYSRAETYSRKMLGNDAYGAAFVKGQGMTLDQALDLALKTVEEIE